MGHVIMGWMAYTLRSLCMNLEQGGCVSQEVSYYCLTNGSEDQIQIHPLGLK